jgi:hypothetical protein
MWDPKGLYGLLQGWLCFIFFYSYAMGSEVKRPERATHQLPPTNVDVNNVWNFASFFITVLKERML